MRSGVDAGDIGLDGGVQCLVAGAVHQFVGHIRDGDIQVVGVKQRFGDCPAGVNGGGQSAQCAAHPLKIVIARQPFLDNADRLRMEGVAVLKSRRGVSIRRVVAAPDGGVGLGDGVPLRVVLGVGEQAAAQDGGKVAGIGGRECLRGARGHRIQFLNYGLDLLSDCFGFVPIGVAAGFRGGDYQRGAVAVGDGFGNGRQRVAQPVAGAAYVLDLFGGGHPARRFINQNQCGPIADEFLESGGAGVAETVIVFLERIVSGFPTQVIGEESGKGFGAAVRALHGHALQDVGVFAGEADQLHIVHRQFRRQKSAGNATTYQFRVSGGGGQGNQGVGFAAAEGGVKAYKCGLPGGAAVAQPVKDAGGHAAHGRRGVGAGKEIRGFGGSADFAAQRLVEVGGVFLAGLFLRTWDAGFQQGK